jgi:putative membrane protein
MTTLTRALLIAVLSAPLAASAQNAPTDKTDTPKSGDTTNPSQPKSDKSDTAKKEKLTENELQIVAHYHDDNAKEIELGKLAAKRASTPAVKQYGEMLVKDHQDFDRQLTAIAKSTSQKIPKEKPTTDAEKQELDTSKKTVANIQKLRGENFDREYLRFMVEDHDRALSKIDSQISEAKNTELADVLRGVKPTLQRHADQARELEKGKAQAAK